MVTVSGTSSAAGRGKVLGASLCFVSGVDTDPSGYIGAL